MPYNFAADSFRTKKNFVAYFLPAKSTFLRKTASLRFSAPLWGSLKATYTLFILRSFESPDCYGCYGATSKYRLKIAVFEGGGSIWPKISGRRGRPPPTYILPITKLNASNFHVV